MATRLIAWLTDEEAQLYREKCKEVGIEYSQLVTLVLCKFLGADIPKKKSKREDWLLDHEIRTREEFSAHNQTTDRIRDVLREADKPLSTKEITQLMGWKTSASMKERLKDMPDVQEVPVPEDYKKRGARPKFWMLIGS